MFNKQNLPIVASGICFVIPVLAAMAMNWKELQPYWVADGKTAKGHVVYLFAPG